MTISNGTKKEILKRYKKEGGAETLALEYGISRDTIHRWMREKNKKKKKRKVPESFTKHYKLDEEDKRKIVTLKKNNPKITYKEIQAQLKKEVTSGPIFFQLKKAGLTKKRNFKYPTLANFQRYQNQDIHILLKEYERLKKDKKNPNYHEIIYSFLLIFRNRGLFKKAATVAHKILKRKTEFIEKLKKQVPAIEGDIYYHLGDSLSLSTKGEKIEAAYLKAYENLEEASDGEETLEFVKGLCKGLFSTEDNTQGIKNLLLETLRETENKEFKLKINTSLGIFYFKNRNYDIAKKYFKDAFELNFSRDDTLASICFNLALCYKNLEEYENAIKYLNLVEEHTKENIFQKADSILLKGVLYNKMSKPYFQIESLYLRSRKLFKEIENNRYYLTANWHLAKLYLSKKKFKKLKKVRKIIKSYFDTPELSETARKYFEEVKIPDDLTEN